MICETVGQPPPRTHNLPVAHGRSSLHSVHLPPPREDMAGVSRPPFAAIGALLLLSISYVHMATAGFALPAMLPAISNEMHLNDLQVRHLVECESCIETRPVLSVGYYRLTTSSHFSSTGRIPDNRIQVKRLYECHGMRLIEFAWRELHSNDTYFRGSGGCFQLIHSKVAFKLRRVSTILPPCSYLYAFALVPIGVLSDRLPRNRLMAAGLASWSALTLLASEARSFGELLAARVGFATVQAVQNPISFALSESDHGSLPIS